MHLVFKHLGYTCCILVSFHILNVIFSIQGEETRVPETLKFVQVIIRHGERTPEYPYPTDPYVGDNFWQEGWGQLTEKGKGQGYVLGQYLRTRYQNFLSENYVPNEIYALSSETDRTIMSAQVCLAGLYPTVNGTSWKPDFKWQPIPFRTLSSETDNFLRFKRECPVFESKLTDYLMNSLPMIKINEENKELYALLSNGSGNNITNIYQIDSFYATMMVEEMLGLPLPSWAEPIVNTENFQYLYNLSYTMPTVTTELKRFRGGPLTEYLTNNLNSKVSDPSMKTKFFLISAHDITLVAILDTLGMLDLQRPYYASAFMLELHQHPDTEDYFVQFYLRNETNREPYQLKLPGCDLDCPLQTFLNYTVPFIPEDWDAECESAEVSVEPL